MAGTGERVYETEVWAVNIYQRINEVRKQCAFIRKDKKVEGGGYMAVTHDAVTAEIREHLIAQGIVIVPRLQKAQVIDTGMLTSKGTPIIRYEARFEIDFVNMDEPTDRVTVPNEAHAMDQGDKAPGKATSYATKYAMLKLFSIETGEDEESRLDAKSGTKDLAKQVAYANVKPNDGAGNDLTSEQKERVSKVASEIIDCFTAEAQETAFEVYEEAKFDASHKLYLWTFLDAKQRRYLNEQSRAKNAAVTVPPREKDLARAEAKGTA
jgi:hypothetical protein